MHFFSLPRPATTKRFLTISNFLVLVLRLALRYLGFLDPWTLKLNMLSLLAFYLGLFFLSWACMIESRDKVRTTSANSLFMFNRIYKNWFYLRFKNIVLNFEYFWIKYWTNEFVVGQSLCQPSMWKLCCWKFNYKSKW